MYNMKYFPKISWGNIYLSPINPEDYELWTKWMNDSRITDGMNQTKSIFSIGQEKDFLEKYSKDDNPKSKAFAIINKNNDKMLWITDLGDIDYIDGKARLWIAIWDYDEHNKWYWTDSVNAILFFGFYTLNLRNIDLCVYSFNEKAIKCYQKCWFREYWRRKESHYCNGKFRDEIYMDITKETWKKVNEKHFTLLSNEKNEDNRNK